MIHLNPFSGFATSLPPQDSHDAKTQEMEHGHTRDEVRQRLSAPLRASHLKDFIYGGIDGTVTTFAIVAGVQGAGLSSGIILALGIANVLADGFSMAASNYTGTTSEKEEIQQLRNIEQRHIRDVRDGELEELREIFRLKGLSGDTLENAVAEVSQNEEKWIDLMLVDEYGRAPVDPKPLAAALATFSAFILCGSVPLAPFLIGLEQAFQASTLATGVTFLCIGFAKSVWSMKVWWRVGLETLAIGATAAAIAYAAGYIVSRLIS